MYSDKLLMMDRGTVRNMYSSISKILFLEISASIWFYYKKVFCRFNVSSIYLFSLKTISVLRKMVRPNWMYMVLRHTHVSWCTAYSLIQNIINRSWTFATIDYKLKNKRPTWCNLIFYFTSYALNMFRTLIYPSSEACDYSVEFPHWSYCS